MNKAKKVFSFGKYKVAYAIVNFCIKFVTSCLAINRAVLN